MDAYDDQRMKKERISSDKSNICSTYSSAILTVLEPLALVVDPLAHTRL